MNFFAQSLQLIIIFLNERLKFVRVKIVFGQLRKALDLRRGVNLLFRMKTTENVKPPKRIKESAADFSAILFE